MQLVPLQWGGLYFFVGIAMFSLAIEDRTEYIDGVGSTQRAADFGDKMSDGTRQNLIKGGDLYALLEYSKTLPREDLEIAATILGSSRAHAIMRYANHWRTRECPLVTSRICRVGSVEQMRMYAEQWMSDESPDFSARLIKRAEREESKCGRDKNRLHVLGGSIFRYAEMWFDGENPEFTSMLEVLKGDEVYFTPLTWYRNMYDQESYSGGRRPAPHPNAKNQPSN